VDKLPGSDSPEHNLEAAGISARCIVDAVRAAVAPDGPGASAAPGSPGGSVDGSSARRG
jgi:hypothetical protein